jgi:predicted metalloprotease with PDZ domain
MRRASLLLALLAALSPPPSHAAPTAASEDPEMTSAIHYRLSFPDARHHYVEVEAHYPTGGAETLDLGMAVWTPGSYLVREFARHVEGLSAGDLPVEKTTKNHWRVGREGDGPLPETVTVRYRVYGREMTVRTNFVDDSFAILNGAPTFVTTAEALTGAPVPHLVEVERPAGWERVVSPLPETGDGRYRADDFTTLVDSPLYAGNAVVHRFTVGGAEHLLVNEGEGPPGAEAGAEGSAWDGPRSAADTERIVREHVDFWGVVPYERYVFFNLITGARGGLEHESSTVIMTSRLATRTPQSYRRWLGLVSHEFFHTWNVKRLRPVELGPFDYENEVYTESLWVAEGVTSYYDDLLVRRAGLIDRDRFLEELSSRIDRLQKTPGREVQPLSGASFDAWIKFYREDENTPNTAVSYYTKGAVVAFLLDAHVRRATGGERSLDDVLRTAYERYSGERGYTREEFEAVVSEVAGADLSAFFAETVDGTGELDYGPALDWFGLRFKSRDEAKEDEERDGRADGKAEDDPEPGWLGATVGVEGGRVMVREVRRGTPAFEGGLAVGDELLALDGYRLPPDDLERLWKTTRPGQGVRLTVARRGRLTDLDVTLGAEPRTWKLQVDPDATEQQTARLNAWLGLPAPEDSR